MSDLTEIHLKKEQVNSAIMSAMRITMSPHEWSWTQLEQEEMAMTILWLGAENSKLLAKYNGVFEWLGRLAICKTYIFAHSDNPRKVAEEIKKAYEESLK